MQMQLPTSVLNRGNDYHSASVLCGASAGLVSTICSNPFEALKTRMAGDKHSTGAQDRRLRTHLRLLFKDGFAKGASVGLLANMVTSVPSNAIYLPTYALVKDTLIAHYGFHPTMTPLCAAMCAVTTTNMTLSPFFVIRTAVQLDAGLTMRRAAYNIYKRDGPRGFYRGTLTNISGRFVEEGLFWLIYENGKRLTNEKPHEFHQGESLFYSVASVLSWSTISKLTGVSLAFPYNTIMTHLRGVNRKTGKHDHTTIAGTVRHVYEHDGALGFYKGLLPQLIRSVISKSTQVLVFELLISSYCQRQGIERPTTQQQKK